MPEAFSRLKSVLDQKGLTTADLVRRISEQGDRINPKSVYRLADPEEPLEKVDMRVVGAICHALEVGIGELLTFEEPTGIEQFSSAKQERMNTLLARDSGGQPSLSAAELEELQALVEEAEAMARRNARRLANRRRRLLRHAGKRSDKPSPDEGGKK
jgi:DNA-binding Xre family transcriptional regulator